VFALQLTELARVIFAQYHAHKQMFLGTKCKGLNGEISCSMKQAQIVSEQWSGEYNAQRPHAAGCGPMVPPSFVSQPLAVMTQNHKTEPKFK
jgi:hypothetical protein